MRKEIELFTLSELSKVSFKGYKIAFDIVKRELENECLNAFLYDFKYFVKALEKFFYCKIDYNRMLKVSTEFKIDNNFNVDAKIELIEKEIEELEKVVNYNYLVEFLTIFKNNKHIIFSPYDIIFIINDIIEMYKIDLINSLKKEYVYKYYNDILSKKILFTKNGKKFYCEDLIS